MDLGLKGKVAVVAGASKGLGKAVAMGLAREGARVAICSRDQARVQATAREIETETGGEVLPVVAELRQADHVDAFVRAAAERFGTVHILFTNSGGPTPGPFVKLTDEQWLDAVNNTLMSAVRLSRACIPYMRENKWGRIIHSSSFSIKISADNLLLSNSIRAAVVSLAKTQSRELAGEGILVNNVLPGWTVTERVGQLMRDRSERERISIADAEAATIKGIPVGRMGMPEEFANVVVFLASERASYVNGVSITVDGGETRFPF